VSWKKQASAPILEKHLLLSSVVKMSRPQSSGTGSGDGGLSRGSSPNLSYNSNGPTRPGVLREASETLEEVSVLRQYQQKMSKMIGLNETSVRLIKRDFQVEDRVGSLITMFCLHENNLPKLMDRHITNSMKTNFCYALADKFEAAPPEMFTAEFRGDLMLQLRRPTSRSVSPVRSVSPSNIGRAPSRERSTGAFSRSPSAEMPRAPSSFQRSPSTTEMFDDSMPAPGMRRQRGMSRETSSEQAPSVQRMPSRHMRRLPSRQFSLEEDDMEDNLLDQHVSRRDPDHHHVGFARAPSQERLSPGETRSRSASPIGRRQSSRSQSPARQSTSSRVRYADGSPSPPRRSQDGPSPPRLPSRNGPSPSRLSRSADKSRGTPARLKATDGATFNGKTRKGRKDAQRSARHVQRHDLLLRQLVANASITAAGVTVGRFKSETDRVSRFLVPEADEKAPLHMAFLRSFVGTTHKLGQEVAVGRQASAGLVRVLEKLPEKMHREPADRQALLSQLVTDAAQARKSRLSLDKSKLTADQAQPCISLADIEIAVNYAKG